MPSAQLPPVECGAPTTTATMDHSPSLIKRAKKISLFHRRRAQTFPERPKFAELERRPALDGKSVSIHSSPSPSGPGPYEQPDSDYPVRSPPPPAPTRRRGKLLTPMDWHDTPQTSWSVQDCRDWVTAFIYANSTSSRELCASKARNIVDDGESIYFASYYHLFHQIGPAAALVHEELRRRKNDGLVVSLDLTFDTSRCVRCGGLA